MSQKLTPLHDRVVVRREPEQQMTAGGIYIPDTAREKPQVGVVVAVGKGHKDKDGSVTPLDVKVGDRVRFGKYAGVETPRQSLEFEGEELLILKEEEILAILEGKSGLHNIAKEKVAAGRR